MSKEVRILLLTFAALFLFLFAIYKTTNKPSIQAKDVKFNPKSFTYFYGTTCPNCQKLNEWIKEKGIAKKLKYEKREVYYNQENALMLEKAAGICKIDNNQIGVPFIYDKGKCYMGIPQAQEILSKKAGLK